MHVGCWIQQVTTRVGAVTCWIQQPVSPKQVVGFSCVLNSEVDRSIRQLIVFTLLGDSVVMEGPSTYLNEFGVRSGSVRDPFGIRSGSVRGPFGIRSGSVRSPFGVRLGSVWAPFRRSGSVWVRSGSVRDPFGSVRAPFGPKFSEPKILRLQKCSICAAVAAAGLASVPSPAARSVPAAAATAAQIDFFLN